VAAGDALYHRDLWRQDTMAVIHYNARQFKQNASEIAGFPDIIIPGHDRVFDNLTGQYLQDDYVVI
jgi:glyoxylase-like metal-dependent hydrolase (beta-lactamase superfamily II)